MRLRGCVLGVAVATMLVVLPNLGCPVVAGEATDHIRTHIDQMYQLVAKTGSTAESREAVQKLADRMFNWNAMAEGVLGPHWRERTPPERAEFVRLFAEVFERAYLSKIQLADAERFAYLGDTMERDHAVVRTRITTNNGTVIPVNYRARMTEGGTWRVDDLDVGGVSLVSNYRVTRTTRAGLRSDHNSARLFSPTRSGGAAAECMPNFLSGTVHEVGEGFIVLRGGTRVAVSSRVLPDGLALGVRVTVTARLRGADWVAEDIQVKN